VFAGTFRRPLHLIGEAPCPQQHCNAHTPGPASRRPTFTAARWPPRSRLMPGSSWSHGSRSAGYVALDLVVVVLISVVLLGLLTGGAMMSRNMTPDRETTRSFAQIRQRQRRHRDRTGERARRARADRRHADPTCPRRDRDCRHLDDCVALTVRTRGRLPGHAQPSLCAAQSAAMVVAEIRNQTLARTRRRMKDLETTPGVVIQGGRASADFGRLLPQSSSASRLTAGASGFELKPIRRAVGD
jgi:hypothetical protein